VAAAKTRGRRLDESAVTFRQSLDGPKLARRRRTGGGAHLATIARLVRPAGSDGPAAVSDAAEIRPAKEQIDPAALPTQRWTSLKRPALGRDEMKVCRFRRPRQARGRWWDGARWWPWRLVTRG